MKACLAVFLFIMLCINVRSGGVSKATLPYWVKPVEYVDDNILDDHSGYQFLLLERHHNLIEESCFNHIVVKVLNSQGIQSLSDIRADYDPSYQSLKFHTVRIIRNGEVIEKLNGHTINEYQRETKMDRHLYDGSHTAVINLSDVRINDIIEYSYSVIGRNPLSKDNYSYTFYQQLTTPVNRIYYKLITPGDLELHFKAFNGAKQAKVKGKGSQKEYIWDVEALDYVKYDENTPSWFNHQKRIEVTSFKSWSDVVKWALPLYSFKEQDSQALGAKFHTSRSERKKILDMIQTVQDEIRYLGFESGMGAYKPNPPTMVYSQRYGDCKDKSLLLVALLQSLGIDACPVLVHTSEGLVLNERLPGYNAFNHCVVYFPYQGLDIYIDPTLSYQGGQLGNIYFPDYC